MTITEARQKLVDWAAGEVGYSEGANNYNKYAEDNRLVKLYGWDTQNQPWCDVFTDEAFIAVFGLEDGAKMTYQPLGDGSAACWRSAQFFQDHDAFYQAPEIGDVIFFYVKGQINHQGIVESVSGGIVHTIEGNSSDSVARRAYSIGAANIAGYGRPNWSAVVDSPDKPKEEEPEPIQEPITIELPVLRNGMCGSYVAAVQGILSAKRYSLGPWGVDGEFGTATLTAVQNFQTRNGLARDGVVGKETWAKLFEW